MKRVPYSEIAESIAAARSENEYARAGSLVDAYYAVCPAPDSVAERIALLGKVLLRTRELLVYSRRARTTSHIWLAQQLSRLALCWTRSQLT